MSQIKAGNTKPEIAVRKLLYGMGYRFRLHDKNLPGKPDIVLRRHKRIILVNGCFWHGHPSCKRAKRPSTNVDFWNDKITRNIERDKLNIALLKSKGWKILVVWSCETSNREHLREKLRRFMEYDETV